MNAYYDKTFVVDSAFIMDVKYYDHNNKLLNFPSKFTGVDMVFTNLKNEKTLLMSSIGTVREGRIRVEASAGEWNRAEKGFFEDSVSDLYGYGGKWHSYALWLKSSISDDRMCVLRGKAKLVKAKK
ncbi:hypothetical protein [Campylobacter sp. RM16188]|uniref:hypothetical protein n=1 Tax=Campylobacter sp. RM16188 TaxID=1705725 RepID=UPI0015550E1E|nr:hypothetical protein [Campylobacter sp. RM16188]